MYIYEYIFLYLFLFIIVSFDGVDSNGCGRIFVFCRFRGMNRRAVVSFVFLVFGFGVWFLGSRGG